MAVNETTCPKCSRALQGGDPSPTWCPNCRWGVDRAGAIAAIKPLPGFRTRYAAYRRLGAVHRDHAPRPDRWTWRRLALLTLATLVHLGGLGLLALSVRLFAAADFVTGVIVLALALSMCPWLRRPNGPSAPLPAEVDIAVVRRWANELADEIGVEPPQRIVVSPGEMASAGRTPQGRRSLRLGLLLFAIFDDEERRSVVRAELARWTRGDFGTSVWAFTARRAVERPLVATGLLGNGEQPFVLRQDAYAQPIGRLGFVILRLAVSPLWLLHAAFVALGTERQMEWTYVADRLATSDGGGPELCHALRVLSLRDELIGALQRQHAQRVTTIDWTEVRSALHAVPDSEVGRRLLVDEARQLRREFGVAPTVDRIRQIQRWAPDEPLPARAATTDIEAAVRPAIEAWSRMLANSW